LNQSQAIAAPFMAPQPPDHTPDQYHEGSCGQHNLGVDERQQDWHQQEEP
jgi:hypothetical protein